MLYKYNDEEKLLNTVYNVLNNEDGFNFICFLLDELQAFEKGSDFQNAYITYSNNAIRAKGQKILDLILKSNFEKYIEVLKTRKEDL